MSNGSLVEKTNFRCSFNLDIRQYASPAGFKYPLCYRIVILSYSFENREEDITVLLQEHVL